MTKFRITKYNPIKRNLKGHYWDDSEWTSISNIGKSEYRNVTFTDYEKIESAYVNAIKLIMLGKKIDSLQIKSLELHNGKQDFKKFEKNGILQDITVDYDKEIKSLKNGLSLNLSEVDKIIRLMLRETVWMQLVNNNIEVTIGYDYYMYVKTNSIESSTIQKIEKSGLFIEPEIEK